MDRAFIIEHSYNKVLGHMKLTIPAFVLCIIGDYCIGAEPRGLETAGFISMGWLTISDIRIAVSNLFGAIGTVMYAIGAFEFIGFLLYRARDYKNSTDRLWVNIYTAGLGLGCISFMYFHISCGEMIHHFNVLYDVTGGDIQRASDAWSRLFTTEAVPYVLFFAAFDVMTTVAWVVLIVRRIIPVSKWWILAAPIITAGIGTAIDLLPLPFSGFNSGFESLGWMLMFICGIGYIKKEMAKDGTEE